MRGADTTSPIKVWKSPIPYLFGSLGFVLMLIAMALILLACSYRKRYNSGDDDHDQENPPSLVLKVLDPEPKIVVVMAGDHKPTYLATPAISSNICCCDQQV